MPASVRSTAIAVVFPCALLLGLFAALACASAWGKAPTYDEPLHVVAAWVQLHHGEFRVDPENPALWKYCAALPMGSNAIDPPPSDEQLRAVAGRIDLTAPFVVPLLFRSPKIDAERIVRAARAAMLILAMTLGAVVACWSWRLGGAVAATAATTLFALDPNFLAHGALVKNDVALSLALLALMLAVWRAGMKLTMANAIAVGLLCAAAVNVKFSALLFGPIVLLLLVVRALMPRPWRCMGRDLRTRAARLSAAAALCAWALLASCAGTWATYGFRFAPSRDAAFHFDTSPIEKSIAYRQLTVENPARPPTVAQVEARAPGLFVRGVMFLHAQRLLPQAWLTGLLFTYRVSILHDNFLAGQYAQHGWWHYFPLAMAVKSPLALLAAAGLALLIGAVAMIERAKQCASSPERWMTTWTAACLILPPAIFLLSAMASNLHYGVRHVLPVFPFLYIGIGLAVAYAWARRRKITSVVAGVLAVTLAVESLSAFPHYIAYFNAAAGGPRGGFKLLGDSNLDWGQDLKLLAGWQRNHPNADLHLAYYGMADPAYYGIRYQNLPGGLGPPSEMPRGRGPRVAAVSATILQGIYSPELRDLYALLRGAQPIEVLGGSIYLFDLSTLISGLNLTPPRASEAEPR